MSHTELLASRQAVLQTMLRERRAPLAELTNLDAFQRMMDRAEMRTRLDAFDDATLQAVVDGNTRLLPIDLTVDASTQAIAAEILKERNAT